MFEMAFVGRPSVPSDQMASPHGTKEQPHRRRSSNQRIGSLPPTRRRRRMAFPRPKHSRVSRCHSGKG